MLVSRCVFIFAQMCGYVDYTYSRGPNCIKIDKVSKV